MMIWSLRRPLSMARSVDWIEYASLALRPRRGGRRNIDADAHHLGSGVGQLDALRRRRLRIRRVGHRHRLNDDGRAAADLQASDSYADRLVQSDEVHRSDWIP